MDLELTSLLTWLDFSEDEIALLTDEGFEAFDDFLSTTKEEFKSMIDGFYKRNDLGFVIPMKRRKLLYDILEWCGDFDRRGMEVGLNWPGEEIETEDSASYAMAVARERAMVRKRLKDKGADEVQGPGTFDPSNYVKWEKALQNKLSSIAGIKSVPLSYVIRIKAEADPDDILERSFIDRTVLQASLTGAPFEADSREVHQILVASTAGTDAEQFLKSVAKYGCGRRDMKIIRDFYEGTGSTNRRLLEAKQTLKHLHYKNERTLNYAAFVAKLTGIFQVLADGDQEKGEAEKVDIYFDKFQCESLKNEIIACKFDFQRNGGTFAATANVMADHIQPIPQGQPFSRGGPRNVSGIGTTHTGSAPSSGVYCDDGTIFTGKYERDEYQLLSKDEMDALKDARSKHTKKAEGGKRKIKATKKKQNIKLKKIAAKLKESDRKLSAVQASQAPTPDDDDATPATGTGAAMGGRAGRRNGTA
jgi:hypothetical protein